MQTIPISTATSTSGNGCQGAFGRSVRSGPVVRAVRRGGTCGAVRLRAPAALALVVPAHVRRARSRAAYPRMGAAQRSDGHRRALHRAPAGDGAGALPRRRPSAAARGRRRADGVLAALVLLRSRRCCACRSGARSRWPGCGSARRSTTSPARTCSGSSSRSSGILPRCSSRWRWRRGWTACGGCVRRAAGPRAARRRAGAHLRRDRGGRAGRVRRLVPDHPGPGAVDRARLMRRLFGYYRQFDELSPEEVSRELLRAPRRGAPRAIRRSSRRWTSRAPRGTGRRTPEVDQRRDVRAAARGQRATRTRAPLRAAIAASHDVEPERVIDRPRRGRAAARGAARASRRGEVEVVWPGWGLLPRLVQRGGRDAGPGRREDARAAHADRGRSAARTTRPARSRRDVRAGRGSHDAG